ncbi:MAG: 50S ribosome-binding GTPase [Phycisphaerales bacterium]|nr:50S ribosome-binding GTPase [Phycisphaerales bacterium]
MAASQAMLLTPPGAAAIAVVRLTGPRVEPFLREHFNRPTPIGRPVHGLLRDHETILDDPVILRINDLSADLNLHGGPWVIHSVMELAGREGFELQNHLELPLADSMLDEQQPLLREVESHLPMVRSELGLRALLAQPGAWRDVHNSFVHLSHDQQKSFIQHCLDDRALIHLLSPPTVAIIGSPNVGKSTLANQLFARKRSITADLPGTTRDWVGEIADIDGLPVLLVDTAGIRRTPDPLERAAIDQSHHQARSADLVLIILNAAVAPDEHERQLLDQYPLALRIINQCDRPFTWDPAGLHPLRTIATTGHGVDALRHRIAATFQCDDLEIPRPRWWTDRQRQILLRALDGHPQALAEL